MKRILKFFTSDGGLKIISLVAAIALWTVVNTVITPTVTRTLTEVPVDLNLEGTVAEALALQVIDTTSQTVDVKIQASRNVIGTISADDISVTPVLTQVTGSGRQTLQLLVTVDNPDVTVISYNPKMVIVDFDRVSEKVFTVETDISKLSIAKGYTVLKGYPAVKEITVTAPESVMSRIKRCCVEVNSDTEVEETSVFTGTTVFYDSEGKVVTSRYISCSSYDISVTVPLYEKKSLPVNITFTGKDAAVYNKLLDYTLSEESIEVIAPTNTSESFNAIELELNLEDMDLKSLKDEIECDIVLPSGYVNTQEVDKITVKIDTDNLATRSFTVTRISGMNLPKGYEFKIDADNVIKNVNVIGTKASVDKLKSSDISAVIDFSDFEAKPGEVTQQVDVYLYGYEDLWVQGDYFVTGTVVAAKGNQE